MIEDITVEKWEGGGEAEAAWSNFRVTLAQMSIQFNKLIYLHE